jgi:hypothetical protein
MAVLLLPHATGNDCRCHKAQVEREVAATKAAEAARAAAVPGLVPPPPAYVSAAAASTGMVQQKAPVVASVSGGGMTLAEQAAIGAAAVSPLLPVANGAPPGVLLGGSALPTAGLVGAAAGENHMA